MYFTVLLFTFIVLLTIVSIFKTLEVFQESIKMNNEIKIIRSKLYAELEIQRSLKPRIKLLDGLNAIMLKRVTVIIKELIDLQNSIISYRMMDN